MIYDPTDTTHRRELAAGIIRTLLTAGFVEEAVRERDVRERVFYRHVEGRKKMRIQVFTTIEGCDDAALVRCAGTDAIRVCLRYSTEDGMDRFVHTKTRVNRTGEIEAICERMIDRARENWKVGTTSALCHCGAPLFISHAGNNVCMDLCFKGVKPPTSGSACGF